MRGRISNPNDTKQGGQNGENGISGAHPRQEIIPGVIVQPEPAQNGTLDTEIAILRGALRQMADCIENTEHKGNIPMYIGILARVANSRVRALLAAHKLDKPNKDQTQIQIKTIFKALGWDDQP